MLQEPFGFELHPGIAKAGSKGGNNTSSGRKAGCKGGNKSGNNTSSGGKPGGR